MRATLEPLDFYCNPATTKEPATLLPRQVEERIEEPQPRCEPLLHAGISVPPISTARILEFGNQSTLVTYPVY